MSRQNGNLPMFFSVIVPFSMENQSNDVAVADPKEDGHPNPNFDHLTNETWTNIEQRFSQAWKDLHRQYTTIEQPFLPRSSRLKSLRGVGFAWLYVGPLCKQFPPFFSKNQEIFQISHPSKHLVNRSSKYLQTYCSRMFQNIPTHHEIPRWSSPVATPWWIWRSTGSGSPTAHELWSCLRESPRRIIPTMAMRSSTWTSVPCGELLRTTNDWKRMTGNYIYMHICFYPFWWWLSYIIYMHAYIYISWWLYGLKLWSGWHLSSTHKASR